MNDFDRFLEFELRQMLDPVVASKAPRRARRNTTGRPVLTVVTAPLEPAAAAPVEPIGAVS